MKGNYLTQILFDSVNKIFDDRFLFFLMTIITPMKVEIVGFKRVSTLNVTFFLFYIHNPKSKANIQEGGKKHINANVVNVH